MLREGDLALYASCVSLQEGEQLLTLWCLNSQHQRGPCEMQILLFPSHALRMGVGRVCHVTDIVYSSPIEKQNIIKGKMQSLPPSILLA